jgi:hypothetical protein
MEIQQYVQTSHRVNLSISKRSNFIIKVKVKFRR